MAVELPNTLDKVLSHQSTLTEIEMQSMFLQVISRLTTKIFLGAKFMDNPY